MVRTIRVKGYSRRASTTGRIARSLAKTTKGGRGRIKNRSSYKKHMKRRK